MWRAAAQQHRIQLSAAELPLEKMSEIRTMQVELEAYPDDHARQLQRQQEWITFYWSTGQLDKAHELGWDGQWERSGRGLVPTMRTAPIEPPPPATYFSVGVDVGRGAALPDGWPSQHHQQRQARVQSPQQQITPQRRWTPPSPQQNGSSPARCQASSSPQRQPTGCIPSVSGGRVLSHSPSSNQKVQCCGIQQSASRSSSSSSGSISSGAGITVISGSDPNASERERVRLRQQTLCAAAVALLASFALVAVVVVLFMLTAEPTSVVAVTSSNASITSSGV